MVVGAKVCDLTEDLWFVCGLYVGILMSPLSIETKRRGAPTATNELTRKSC